MNVNEAVGSAGIRALFMANSRSISINCKFASQIGSFALMAIKFGFAIAMTISLTIPAYTKSEQRMNLH